MVRFSDVKKVELTVAVKLVQENLQQVVEYHSNLTKGAEDEVSRLKYRLQRFKAPLIELDKRSLRNDVTREHVRYMCNALNDAEDIIDTYIIEAAAANSRNCFVRAFSKPLYLQDIRTRVQLISEEIMDSRNKYIGKESPQPPPPPPREVKMENIVGFTEESDKIIEHLSGKTNCLDLISIIGMPGLGKTTLASKVFHDERIQCEFPTRIWVYISQNFREKDVFLAILEQLMMDLTLEESYKYRKMKESDDRLVQEIKIRLKDKKFLIVLDDVWTPQDWRRIQHALPMTNHTGKVLITSCHEVLNAVNQHTPSKKGHVVRPNLLNEVDSWLLLQYEVFGEPECPTALQGYGKEIARKCHGLPLAIAVIGGVLFNISSASDDPTQQREAWEKVSRSVRTHLYDVEKIIAFRYDDLPFDLRACFLYLGMFPEDFEIPVWKLIRMWIAEGFIGQMNGLSLEEVAEIKLDELIRRNLVKTEKTRSNGRVKTCRIHPLLRAFCIQEAGSVEEKFFHEVKGNHQGQISGKCRRICTDSIITSSIKFLGPHVRSFVCFSKERVILSEENTSIIPSVLKLLRILEAESITFKRIPEEMYKLLALRYLTLSTSNLRVIPEALSKLWKLETFVVCTEEGGEGIVEIKADIWQLRQLRHLKTNRETKFPEAKESYGNEGKKLQSLGRISPRSCTEEVFRRACNLKELVIDGALNDETFKNLEKLGCLEKLKLHNQADRGIGRLPPYSFPPKLKILTLCHTGLDWDGDMNIKDLLEKLEVLKLKEQSFTKGSRWEAKDVAFRRLEFLHIDCRYLKAWEALGHHYPRLRHLRLHDTAYSSLEVPMGLVEIPNLQVLELSGHYRDEEQVAAEKFVEARKVKLGEQNVNDGAFNLLLTGTRVGM